MCFLPRVVFCNFHNFPCGISRQMFSTCFCLICLMFVIFLGFGIRLFHMDLIMCFVLVGSLRRLRMARFMSFETRGLFENMSSRVARFLFWGFRLFRSHCLYRLLVDSRCFRWNCMISGLILLDLFGLLIVSLLIFLLLIFGLILVDDLILEKKCYLIVLNSLVCLVEEIDSYYCFCFSFSIYHYKTFYFNLINFWCFLSSDESKLMQAIKFEIYLYLYFCKKFLNLYQLDPLLLKFLSYFQLTLNFNQ